MFKEKDAQLTTLMQLRWYGLRKNKFNGKKIISKKNLKEVNWFIGKRLYELKMGIKFYV